MIAFNVTFCIIVILALAIMMLRLLPQLMRRLKHQTDLTDGRGTMVLSKGSTLSIRGIAIMLMILHHFSQYFENLGPLQHPISQCGYALTAVFFFLSGYGCWYSVNKLKRSTSLKSRCGAAFIWFLKHSVRLYLDFLMVLVLNILIFKAIGITEDISFHQIVKDLLTFTLPTWVTWYPKIQIACYGVLALAWLLNEKRKDYIVLLITVVYVAVLAAFNVYSMWYTSVICFPLGLLIADNIKKISQKKAATHYLILMISAAMFAMTFVLSLRYLTIPLRMISVLTIPFLLTAMTAVVNFENRFYGFVGNISFEIYLFHLILIRVMESLKIDTGISLIIIMVCAVTVGWVINKLTVTVNRKVFERA